MATIRKYCCLTNLGITYALRGLTGIPDFGRSGQVLKMFSEKFLELCGHQNPVIGLFSFFSSLLRA